jgi:hypothetical protein
MSGDLDDNEVARVLALPFPARYEYFLERVAAAETLWSLADEQGWVLLVDSGGTEWVPVWPHLRFAAACALENWAGATPRAIPLGDWLDTWTPGMIADQRIVGVFPTPDAKAIRVDPEELEWDLKEQLSGRVQEDQQIATNGHSD